MDKPASIRFTHSRQQQLFRLLELPPDLLQDLESDNPPTLYIKSASQDPSISSTSKSGASEFANLCTPTSTYALRQVNSSNSIFVIKPSPQSEEGKNELNEQLDKDGKRSTVTAIAQCKSTLEVHKAGEGDSASLFLHKLATVYDITDAEEDALESHDGMEVDDEDAGSPARSRARLFADIPVSFSECRRAWVEDCAFVHWDSSPGRWVCRWPTAAVKLLVWKKLFEGAVLQGINLEEQFLVRDLWKAMLDEDAPVDTASGPFPRPLFESVVRRLTDGSGSDAMKDIDSGLNWANLDKDRTVAWLGEIYLETTAPNLRAAITRKAFLNEWANLLPEKWRSEASIDKLKAKVKLSKPRTVNNMFQNEHESNLQRKTIDWAQGG